LKDIADVHLLDSDLLHNIVRIICFFSDFGWEEGHYKIAKGDKFVYPFYQNQQDLPKIYTQFHNLSSASNEISIELFNKYFKVLQKENILEKKGRFLKFSDISLQSSLVLEQEQYLSKFCSILLKYSNFNLLLSYLRMVTSGIALVTEKQDSAFYQFQKITNNILEISELNSIELLNIPTNSKILYYICLLSPEETIAHIYNLFTDEEALSNFPLDKLTERNNFRNIIRFTIKKPPLFPKTMDILLLLSEFENENYINNATGLFSYYFCKNIPNFGINLSIRREYLEKKIVEEEKRIIPYLPSILSNIYRTQGDDYINYGSYVKTYFLDENTLAPEQKQNRGDLEYEQFGFDLIIRYHKKIDLFPLTINSFWKLVHFKAGWETLESIWRFYILQKEERKYKLIEFLSNYKADNITSFIPKIAQFIQDIENKYDIFDQLKKELQKPRYKFRKDEYVDFIKDFVNNLINLDEKIISKVEKLAIYNHELIGLIAQEIVNKLEDKALLDEYYQETSNFYLNLKQSYPFTFFIYLFQNVNKNQHHKYQQTLNPFFESSNFRTKNLELLKVIHPLDEYVLTHLERLKNNDLIKYKDYQDFDIYFNAQYLKSGCFTRFFNFYFDNNQDLDIWEDFPSGFFTLAEFLEKNPKKIEGIHELLYGVLTNFKLDKKSYKKEFSRYWIEFTTILMDYSPEYLQKFLKKFEDDIFHPNFPSDYKYQGISPFYQKCLEIDKIRTFQSLKALFSKKEYDTHAAILLEYKFDLNFLTKLSIDQILELCQINEEEIPNIFLKIIGKDIYHEKSRGIIAELWQHYHLNKYFSYHLFNCFNEGTMVSNPGQTHKVYENRLKRFQEWSNTDLFKKIPKFIELINKRFMDEIDKANSEDSEFEIGRY
jgi:hypothetical protein